MPMNDRQKQALNAQLITEQSAIDELRAVYQEALDGIEKEIAYLNARQDQENLSSIAYQKQYQESLRRQVSGILDQMNEDQFNTVSDFLLVSYENGYVGTMYDLAGQDVPIVAPIDQKRVVQAVTTDSKLSKPLYDTLGEDVDGLKSSIQQEVTRGVIQGKSYNEIARGVEKRMVGDYSKFNGGAYAKAVRIARTEGHRVQNTAAYDAQKKAQSRGANIVKQWDATLDGRTRDSHARVDGELRQLDEKFSNGLLFPGDPHGEAAEVVNCRCALLQRAKWALDQDELDRLQQRAEFYGLDKAESFENFKAKYLKITTKKGYNDAVTYVPFKTIEECEEYAKRFFGDGYSPTFQNQAVYKGISVEHANEINRTLTELYQQYDIPSLHGIKAISPTSAQGKKVFKDGADAVAAYSPVEHGIFLNRDTLANAKTLEAYNRRSADAWALVMQNVDSLSGSQRELALTYQHAGRALVGDGSVGDYITHEMGHHVQWEALDAATNNAIGRNMGTYAPQISGYANASKSEYIAESFVAHAKGESDLIDPAFASFLDQKSAATGTRQSATALEYAKGGTSSLETVWLPKDEYAHVMSELATNLTEEEKGKAIITRPIGNYSYTVENNGFGNYRIIGKRLIDGDTYGYIKSK